MSESETQGRRKVVQYGRSMPMSADGTHAQPEPQAFGLGNLPVYSAEVEGEPLPPQLRDHPLRGEFAGSRDCHIEPDWVLIYSLTENGAHVRFERTGTHSDLFR